MTQKHIAFLAGTDPIVGYKLIEKELRGRFKGMLGIKKPLNQKQGFLLADFANAELLKIFLENKKIDVFSRQILVSPYLTGEARKQKQDSLQKCRLFVRNIPASWDTQRLNQEFQQLGDIHQAYIVDKSQDDQGFGKHRNPGSKFGYVITQHIELAEKLVLMGNINFGDIKLHIKRHKEDPHAIDFGKRQAIRKNLAI